MIKYGIIGYPLGHSFSRGFFTEKFAREGIDAQYLNFEIPDVAMLRDVLRDNPELRGLNVTLPHKQAVIPLLDEMSDEAREIGAVNVIRVRDGRLRGYNSDIIGFSESIKPLLKPHHTKALVLGTGGASKAKNLAKAITEYTQTDKQIRFAKGLPLNIKLASNIHVPEDSNLNTLMALLLKGDQNCVGEAPEITEVSPVEAEEPAVGISTKEDEPAVVDSSANLQDENAEEEKKPKKDGNVKKKIHNVFSVIKKMLTDPEEEDEEITDEN